jgi:hypothetical protein
MPKKDMAAASATPEQESKTKASPTWLEAVTY